MTDNGSAQAGARPLQSDPGPPTMVCLGNREKGVVNPKTVRDFAKLPIEGFIFWFVSYNPKVWLEIWEIVSIEYPLASQ